MPKVSVIMSAYNAEPYVAEAVESILAQTFTDFEFIVIDDGSTDGTCHFLTDYDDPRLVLVSNKENIGLTCSLNKGLALASGEYIARQDADDVSLPTRLEQQTGFLDHHPEVGLLGTSWINIDEMGRPYSVDRMPTDDSYVRENLLTSLVINHPTVMFRRNCITKVGAYREIAGSAEDVDLWLRIAEHFQVSNLQEPLCKVRVHGKSVVRSGLQYHLESLYSVRQMTLERWQTTGNALSSPSTVARCYLLLACQDFLSKRIQQGEEHFCQALVTDPSLASTTFQNTKDIANFAIWACQVVGVDPGTAEGNAISHRYIADVVSRLSNRWKLSEKEILAHLLMVLSFKAYTRNQFGRAIGYALLGMAKDTRICRNRGLWRIVCNSLIRKRTIL